jgi:hypothetical protein
VAQGSHVLRRQIALVHALAEKGDVIVGALDNGLQALQLQVAQLVHREKIRRADRMERQAGMGLGLSHKAISGAPPRHAAKAMALLPLNSCRSLERM